MGPYPSRRSECAGGVPSLTGGAYEAAKSELSKEAGSEVCFQHASDRGRRSATLCSPLLPAVVGEGLIRLRHPVDVVLALVRAALLRLGVDELSGEALGHRALAAVAGELHEPADGERPRAAARDLDRDLVGRASHAARADLEHGGQLPDRLLERLDRLVARAARQDLERVVDDLLGERLLAVGHDLVDHLLHEPRALHGVGIDRADARQVLDAPAAHEHDGVLLEVVSLARDVGGDLHPVGQPHARDLAQGGVRLLGRGRVHASAHAPALRRGDAPLAPLARLEAGRRDLPLGARSALADELVDARHPAAHASNGQVSDRRLEHHRAGSGEPLLLLHGVGHTWRAWRGMLPELEGGFDVVAPDLPGFGGSAPLPAGTAPTPAALADAVERELDALGWEAPYVAGNSLGGQIALELARRGRARTVVAVSPAGMWTPRESLWGRSVLRLMRTLSFAPRPDLALRLAPVRLVVAGGVLGRPWRADPGELAEATLFVRKSSAFGATSREVHRRHPEGLGEIRAPVLVVWGTRDRLTLPRQATRWVAAIPGAELRWLPGLGHLPMLEDPELVAHTIRDFIARAGGAPAPGSTASGPSHQTASTTSSP